MCVAPFGFCEYEMAEKREEKETRPSWEPGSVVRSTCVAYAPLHAGSPGHQSLSRGDITQKHACPRMY